MDALESPVKKRIQNELDKIDVEKLIHDKIPTIEEQARLLRGMSYNDNILLEETDPGQDLDDQGEISDSEENRGPS